MQKCSVISYAQMIDNAEYAKRAQYYDLEFDDKSDRGILESLVNSSDKYILEIPCGSGRNCLWLALSQKQVVLGDLEPEMVEIVERKLLQIPTHHNVHSECMDMSTFTTKHKLDLILVPREGFQLLDKHTASLTLINFAKNLSPHGRLYIDLANIDLLQVSRKSDLPRYIAHQSSLFSLDVAKIGVDYSFKRWHKSGKSHNTLAVTFQYNIIQNGHRDTFTSSFNLRGYDLLEISGMIEQSGLNIESVYGGYDRALFTPDSARMILIIRGGK